MELANAPTETNYYSKITETSTAINTIPGYPTTDNYTNPNASVSDVDGTTNKNGPGITLKVMAGDKFNIRVSSWWQSNSAPAQPNSSNPPLQDLLSTIAGGISGIAGIHFSALDIQNSAALSPAITNFLSVQNNNTAGNKPKAFLNWILFDEQFKFVQSSSGVDPVGGSGEFTVHTKTDLPVDKNGYLYIYVSNETPNIPVFFDNLQVTQTHGPLLEETHYYPFGLTMMGISIKSAGSLENRYKYNGKELQSKEFSDGSGLVWEDYGARMYDPQVGRWPIMDPLLEKFASVTPYNYCLNSPINNIDPDGMAAKWNGKYGDESAYTDDVTGENVSWDDVQKQNKIGDYATSRNVMLFQYFGKGTPKDFGGAIDIAFEAAKKLPDGNVTILQVKDINDAVEQIDNLSGTIENLFIASHGLGSVGSQAYFAIGTTTINSADQITNKYSKQFAKIAAKLSASAEIVLMACHAGATQNHGIELISALAKKLNATVFGNQSWSAASSGMFNNGGFFSKTVYPRFNGVPQEHLDQKSSYQDAIKNEGKWTKAMKDGTTSTITNVYFDSSGKIRYQ